MTRLQLVKQLAERSTRALPQREASPAANRDAGCDDLFVWFEDTSERRRAGRRGIAGLPESLLPYADGMRVVDRRYCEGHLHLLSAVRVRCTGGVGERIAAIYTAALSVGTVAWIGTGVQYEITWREMYPYGCYEDAAPLPGGLD